MARYSICQNLTVSRNNTKIKLSWKLPWDCPSPSKINLSYRIEAVGEALPKITKVTLSGSATSYELTINPAEWYPATSRFLYCISFWISVPNGAETGLVYNFQTPSVPELIVSGNTFTWSTSNIITSPVYFQDVEYQTCTSDSEKEPNWSGSSVSTGTGQATGSQSYTGDNKYRHFRIRARSVRGASAWIWKYKNNKAPTTATISTKSALVRSITSFEAFFKTSADIDSVIVNYCIGTPSSGYNLPVSPSWESYEYTEIKANKTYSQIITHAELGEDESLWIRFDAVNGGNTYTGTPFRLDRVDTLTSPEIVSFSRNTSTHQVTIDYTSETAVTGTYVALCDKDGKVMARASATAGTVTGTYEDSVDITKENFGIYSYYPGAGSSGWASPKAKSDTVWQEIDLTVPRPPKNLTVVKTADEGKVSLSWVNQWPTMNATEISWATDTDAWNSNLEPETYIVKGTGTSFLIAGLDSGKRYYFRIRSISMDTDVGDVYGPYNARFVSIDLSEVPTTPAVWVSDEVITQSDGLTVYWTYISNDSTPQQSAYIYVDDVLFDSIDTAAQSYSFVPGWNYGSTHTIKVKTVSESGRESDISNAVTITVANTPTASVVTSLVNGELKAMPLRISTQGAGTGGTTAVSIYRDGALVGTRPDGTRTDGFDGETIYSRRFVGNLANYDIKPEALTGRLDDGASYILQVTVYDSLGQQNTTSVRFTVAWTHQPEAPTVTVTKDETNKAVLMTVAQPSSYVSGDYFEVYRLSRDNPELIITDGEYATQYIDPYPASQGGYRIVNYTANGDYVNDVTVAMVDIDHTLVIDDMIIDYDGNQVILPFNPTLKSTWTKDFERTKYLNGSVKGDWNKGVTRDVNGTIVITKDDIEQMEALRQLAEYDGICHIRTPEGSSYAADIQIGESGAYSDMLISYDLKISRVEPQGNDGMTLAEWEAEQETQET